MRAAGASLLVILGCLLVNGENLAFRTVADLQIRADTGSAGLDSHQMALLGDLHNGVEITFHSGFTGAYKAVQTGGLDVSCLLYTSDLPTT